MIEEEKERTMTELKASDILEMIQTQATGIQYQEMQALLHDVLDVEIGKFRKEVRETLYGLDSRIGVRAVIDYLTERYRITFDELQSHSRKAHIVEARQICHWMIRNRICRNALSLSSVGKLIGRKDHTTVLHSTRAVNNHVAVDRIYRERLMLMCNELGARVKWLPEDKELLVTGYIKTPKNETISDKTEGQTEHA